MALTLTPITTGGRSRTPLADVDDDVKLAVEEALEWCASNPAGRLESPQFTDGNGNPSKSAAEDFLHDARSYAYQRPEGRVVVSGNATGKAVVRFRVTPYIPADSEHPDT